MRYVRRPWVVIGLVVFMTTACATGRAVRNASTAANQGDWDTAVAYYRQALLKEPNNVELRIALDRAARVAGLSRTRFGRVNGGSGSQCV